MSESHNAAEIPSDPVTEGGDVPITAVHVDEVLEAASVAATTVGQQLRAARLGEKLSITDVAQALKFSPRQIELLEQDDYAALPGMTIVRGFVRSYSRLLKLDTEGMLSQLDAASPLVLADVRPPDNMGEAGTDGDRQQMGPMLSLAIVILLAALILAGWHFLGPKSALTAYPAGTTATPAVSALPETAPTVQADTAPAVAPIAAATEAFAAPALLFVFNGRSWLEVTDADTKLLHRAENPAGSQLSLGGKPPFEVVVGNAANVKLTYGERVIDLLPYTRADVARLKVE